MDKTKTSPVIKAASQRNLALKDFILAMQVQGVSIPTARAVWYGDYLKDGGILLKNLIVAARVLGCQVGAIVEDVEDK